MKRHDTGSIPGAARRGRAAAQGRPGGPGKRAAAAVLAAAVVLAGAAGCAGPGVSLPEIALPEAPAAVAASAAPADTSCNPKASLRPSGSLPAPGQMPAGSYMRKIQNSGALTLGTGQDALLFSSRNPITGAVVGFDVDVARLIAQAIFGDSTKIKIQVMGYADRVTAVKDGKVDVVAGTLTATCVRLREIDFSSVYFQAAKRVLVSTASQAKSLDDLAGRRICAAQGSTSMLALPERAAKQQPNSRPVARATFGECLVALQRNEVDAISGDDAVLAGLAAQDPYTRIVGPRMSEEPYAVGTAKEHPEFTRFVNAVLAKARTDGTWTRTYDRWLGDVGAAPKPPVAEYKD